MSAHYDCGLKLFRLAGTLVLVGLALGVWVNSWWLLLPAFVGFNMLQYSFTGFCPATLIMGKLGLCEKVGESAKS